MKYGKTQIWHKQRFGKINITIKKKSKFQVNKHVCYKY